MKHTNRWREHDEHHHQRDRGTLPLPRQRRAPDRHHQSLGQCLASRKAYRAGVCRKITDREIDAAALAVYTGTSGMGFEEVEPLWSKLNPDAKEQYRRLAWLAITAARTEALK